MGASGPIDGLRRALARLGTQVRVGALDAPLGSSARTPAPPRASVNAIAPLARGCVAVAAVAGPAPAVRGAGPGAGAVAVRGRATTLHGRPREARVDPAPRATARAVESLPRTVPAHAGATLPDAAPPRRAGPLVPPATRRATHRDAGLMCRAPLAWDTIGRERLRAAWDAVRAAHAPDAQQIELVGVYGPVPVSALAGAAVGDDRVAHLALGPHRGAPRAGDLALARHRGEGRLVSAVVTGRISEQAVTSAPAGRCPADPLG